ncbi:response regulator transcription factor [Thermaerobacillus caldiproteolyticus]|uniref:DNA-binding response OmpR family regulator n=1 Tax=Thermaerobacillus caldiproteolyticus TaxID=247480 RepID=A0A7V9Z6U7_9BACL|nr:response regulator transcription factor [Anoxybacillus caldiproteolyticus]MBA2875086.1 DNA-binding response OmpR family regulator [Anoxybacillus caldiproteolyticus]QPA32939.1 response regulator transcription factor [Anoxybacillus caldiproteolyticus]
MNKRILIIEDEANLARFIELDLTHEGYEVCVSHDGREGLEMALSEDWGLILLDLMLPNLNGMEVCRRVRSVKQTPIIMITARDSVFDRVMGLDSGADDYIVKPFAIEELLARIRALFRRVQLPSEGEQILTFKDLTVDLNARTVKKGDEIIELTKREYDLLVTFLQNINIVLTRDTLLNKVWGFDTEVETNVVDVYVRYLRHKLDENDKESYIQTVRGAGYVMRP